MANIELPKDAEGREIPLDTKVLYNDDGKCFKVNRFTYSVVQTMPGLKWGVVFMDCQYDYCSSFYLTPPETPDSWEKLEEDFAGAAPAHYPVQGGRCERAQKDDARTRRLGEEHRGDRRAAHKGNGGCRWPMMNAFRGNYIHICETLADLIDRPTCKIILARELRTAYGKPITGINGYILSCGHQAVGFAKPRYCPECGMEVGE